MNSPDSSTVNTTAKKIRFSFATRALFLGLVLALPGAPTLAVEKPSPGIEPSITKDYFANLSGSKSAGTPLQGIPVGLEGDPGSIKVSAKTDSTGAFKFDKLPAGKYKLTLAGQLPQSITVGADGIAAGKMTRGNDGSINIFDRWGNRVAKQADGLRFNDKGTM